jgi:hypothetical protein
MAEQNHPEKRPGPFAQDRSRTPPTREQREKDYRREKEEIGAAFKRQGQAPIKQQGKDERGLPPDDESKSG